MKIKDLIYMDRQPFNRNTAIDMQERYRKPDYHRVLLSLYFQYYNKFSEVMGVDLYMPQLSLWIGTDDLQDDRDIREAGGKLQYQKVMQWPGWESFSVQSDNVWETEHLFRKFLDCGIPFTVSIKIFGFSCTDSLIIGLGSI